jgi:hypothetical protein
LLRSPDGALCAESVARNDGRCCRYDQNFKITEPVKCQMTIRKVEIERRAWDRCEAGDVQRDSSGFDV